MISPLTVTEISELVEPFAREVRPLIAARLAGVGRSDSGTKPPKKLVTRTRAVADYSAALLKSLDDVDAVILFCDRQFHEPQLVLPNEDHCQANIDGLAGAARFIIDSAAEQDREPAAEEMQRFDHIVNVAIPRWQAARRLLETKRDRGGKPNGVFS